MKPTNALIGSLIERLEDLRFVRGPGEYVDDVTRVGLLHAAILRSSIAHGRIRSIDAAAARGLPRVHSIITAADIGSPVPIIPMRLHPLPELQPFLQPVMAHDKARYVGEPIAHGTCIRGWIGYYGHFYKTQLRPTLTRIDPYVIRWARRKFKRMRHQTKGARDWFGGFRRANRHLFAYWVLCHGNG
jgi:hypothetical protein